jgi:hypothetical protein
VATVTGMREDDNPWLRRFDPAGQVEATVLRLGDRRDAFPKRSAPRPHPRHGEAGRHVRQRTAPPIGRRRLAEGGQEGPAEVRHRDVRDRAGAAASNGFA